MRPLESLSSTVKLFFHDKRFTVGLLFLWMFVSCTIFAYLGAFHNQFMTLGPSENTVFMAMKINTWPKWYALAVFSMLNTTINEFIASSLVPWFQNTIQDQKTRYLDHSKRMCLFISIVFDIYSHVMGIFGLYLMFSQIDFLVIRMMADIVVTTFTTLEWMKNKQVDKVLHDREGCLGAFNTPPEPTDGAGGGATPLAAVALAAVFGTDDEPPVPAAADKSRSPANGTGADRGRPSSSSSSLSFPFFPGKGRANRAEEEQGPLLPSSSSSSGSSGGSRARLPSASEGVLRAASAVLAGALAAAAGGTRGASSSSSSFTRLRDDKAREGDTEEMEDLFEHRAGGQRRRDPDVVIVFDASRH